MGLCQVRALRTYVDCIAQWRGSDQLFVCFGGRNKGSAVTKQRMSHWIVEAISLAYETRGLTSPPLHKSSGFFSGFSERIINGRYLCCGRMVLS